MKRCAAPQIGTFLALLFLLGGCSLPQASLETMGPTEAEGEIGKTVGQIQTELAKGQPDMGWVAKQAHDVSSAASALAESFEKQGAEKHGTIRANLAKELARDAAALNKAALSEDRPAVDASARAMENSWSELAEFAPPD